MFGRLGAVAACLGTLALAACAADQERGGSATSAMMAPIPSGEGVVRRDGFAAMVAGPGDTVSILAARAGIDAAALAAFNGIAIDTPLRAGDELVIPPRR